MTEEADPKVALGLLLIVGSTLGAIGVIELVRPATTERARPGANVPGELMPSELDFALPTGSIVVPGEILDTASVQAAPWAPGLALLATSMAGPWEGRRATIRDQQTGDARGYLIGDLLPHGSLLVGLSTGTADVMVADRTLVRLSVGGQVITLEDFRTADEGQALRQVSDADAPYRRALLDTLELARSPDALVAQQAVDDLIDAGEPVVEVLITRVDGALPMPGVALAFPSAGGRRFVPIKEGDLVVGILERLTGQSFGDVGQADLGEERRQEIHRAWLRWWGLE